MISRSEWLQRKMSVGGLLALGSREVLAAMRQRMILLVEELP